MHVLTSAVIRRLKEHPDWSLLAALADARVLRLTGARFLLVRLEDIVPYEEWERTWGADAIAALELADP